MSQAFISFSISSNYLTSHLVSEVKSPDVVEELSASQSDLDGASRTVVVGSIPSKLVEEVQEQSTFLLHDANAITATAANKTFFIVCFLRL